MFVSIKLKWEFNYSPQNKKPSLSFFSKFILQQCLVPFKPSSASLFFSQFSLDSRTKILLPPLNKQYCSHNMELLWHSCWFLRGFDRTSSNAMNLILSYCDLSLCTEYHFYLVCGIDLTSKNLKSWLGNDSISSCPRNRVVLTERGDTMILKLG